MKQRFTSKQTSINSIKAPAVYSMKRAVNVMTGKTVVDIGGGRFDTAAEAARVYGAAVSIYDPFNRTPEHNAAVLAGSYDVAVISNVLNVIDSEAARGDVVRLAATKAAALLIQTDQLRKTRSQRLTFSFVAVMMNHNASAFLCGLKAGFAFVPASVVYRNDKNPIFP